MKKYAVIIITGLLIVSLASLQLKAAGTNSDPIESGKSKPNTVVIVCFVGVVVAAGFVIYSVYRCAKSAGLTNPPNRHQILIPIPVVQILLSHHMI